MLSAVILTKNKEQIIASLIDSLKFCEEIIIIDDYSQDQTIDKAKEKNAKVYLRKLDGDFADQRNFGMEKCREDWIFFIDADEEISTDLAIEIKNKINFFEAQEISAYYIKRRDIWWGRPACAGRELKFGETKKARQKGLIRLVKKNSGKWIGAVHEVFKTSGKTSILNNYLKHKPHQTISEFLKEINFYSTIRAKELFKQEKRTNVLEIIFFPFAKFIYNYFLNLGFLDGVSGFVYIFIMSFHSFLVRAKLYLMKQEVK